MAKQLKRFTFNKEAGLSVLKGAGIAGLGAVLAYVVEFCGNTDFGELTPVIVALASILVNAARKFIEKK